jgi:predicted ATP-grasp superfamily ATP-dependent carboligase
VKALVLSAETPSACAVVRSLYAVGFEVTVLAEAWWSPAAMSRCCAHTRIVGAWNASDLDAAATAVAADVVVPVTEGDLVRLAPIRERVAWRARVVAPTAEALDEATDKTFTSKAAEALGVAIPRQWIFEAKAPAIDAAPAPFPLVVKPARSRVLRADGTVWGGTAAYVADLATLRTVQAAHTAAGVATIVQAPVHGAAVLASVLVREDGTPSLVFVHRRIREARPEGGPSACAMSVPPDPLFVEPAVNLARAMGIVGVPAQFEFRSPANGPPVLLDVNARPWGTLGLALDCGVNFYGLAARRATGDELPAPPPPYRAGVERHYLPFELRRAWTAVAGHPQAGYPGPWPDKFDAAFEWLYLPSEGLVGKLDDPLPAFGDVVRLAARALSGDKG